ncbi:MAG: CoA transferase subunit A [Synergistaceae bacterium]|jgi:acetate CoA/acetoacetate CoA-transferase alpha subunit|nr:CoA transferase subunit A [Synergistaceae bacterium]
MDKVISAAKAADFIKDGMTIMVGGFIANGTPETLIDALVAKGVKNLTLICNDTGVPERGAGKMVVKKQFRKIVASHVGTNPETGRQMNVGETEVVLIPQGTLAERIRCGGIGLGGFLTPTGIGTEVEEGKQKMTVNGQEYLLELPLRADVALLYGSIVDKSGNIVYTYTQRNFNPMMAMAADLVICEAGSLVEVGEIDPNNVMTPGIFVDYIVRKGDV